MLHAGSTRALDLQSCGHVAKVITKSCSMVLGQHVELDSKQIAIGQAGLCSLAVVPCCFLVLRYW